MPIDLLKRLFPRDVHHLDGLHSRLQELMPPSGRVLDLGCGTNNTLALYRTACREVWGTDFEPHPRLEHRQWFRPLGAGGVIPFPSGSFDVVVAVMVLEHVADPAFFLQEAARVLRPGGHFIGHSVSGSHYVAWLRRFVGLFPHSFNRRLVRRLYGRAEQDTFPAFYRLNRRRQLERLSRDAGFTAPRLARYADPGYFRFSRPLYAAAIVTDRLLELIGSGWGRLYFTVTMRRESVDLAGLATRPADR